MDSQLKIELVLLSFILVIARITYVIHKITTGFSKVAPKRTKPCRTAICIGSGGHTTEMLRLLQNVNLQNYSPRYYIIAQSDVTSLRKVQSFEESKHSKLNQEYFIISIPRSRSVGQSYFTSVLTTIASILYSVPIVVRLRFDLILCNGPGTCIPICLISFLLRCAFIRESKIVFIESLCRTETFSLTGKILIYMADNFIVQWPSLKAKLKRAEYIGQLM
ncbi:UDP-N-acetylglucosamine transferase subunit ALG14 homolog [Dendroctonus ponderosae]|uniref:UDP-N-acetylglucosamine transferase subunit ALG14 n=1 Tax=Dendroctonus ponderosae TaxID=77166 RepID=J3JUP5_DENPD